MASANATRALLKTRYCHSDIYVGTQEQLCAAGLVKLGQFPGHPGMPRVCATYFLQDSIHAPTGSRCFEATYSVQRLGAARYEVSVDVCEEEAKRRKAFQDEKYNLPLDLPGTPATHEPAPPAWSPAGWVFRKKRTEDYVFIVSAEQLRASGLLEHRPLPGIEDEKRRTVRISSPRFGWVIVSQRAADVFFVALDAPSEIRCAKYEASDYGYAVYHKGTKEQLQARGLGVGHGFPGEPGCNVRKVTTANPMKGSEMRIELLRRSEWCGDQPRFEVVVRRSEAEQEVLKTVKAQAEAEKRCLERLKTMPATADKYRDDVADTFWTFVSYAKRQMQSTDGYRFTSEVVDEFVETATEAYWTIKNGQTTGASPRKRLQQVMSASARADKPLQQFLATVLGGEAH